MTRTTYLMAAIMLAGCNTPSMTFRGITPVTVTVDGSTFAVRVKDLHGEAIRTNMQYAPRTGPIGARGATAIAQVSGCKVSRVGGDQAVVTAALDCGKGPPPLRPILLDYECYSRSGQSPVDKVSNDLDVECTAVKRR